MDGSIDESVPQMETEGGSGSPQNTTERVQRTRDPNRFPITRIRTIMKLDPDLSIASQESVYLITKAAVSQQIYYTFLIIHTRFLFIRINFIRIPV